jgi:hypothetical protein
MLFGFTVIKIFEVIGFVLSKLIRKRHLGPGKMYDFLQDPLTIPYRIMSIIGIPCMILSVITESVYFAIPLIFIVVFGITLLISILILGGFVYDVYGPFSEKMDVGNNG